MSAPELHSSARRSRGATIIELMVAIVVGMLVALAAAGSVQIFSASQRQGMGVGRSVFSSTNALSAIKHDIAQAGLGFFGEGAYTCATLNLSVGASVIMDNAPFSPVMIRRTPGTNFDSIQVTSATAIAGGASVITESPTTGASTTMYSYLPASEAQAVLLTPNPQLTGNCTVRSITKVNRPTPPALHSLEFDSTGPNAKHNSALATFTAPPNFPADSRVVLLGSLIMNNYTVNAAQEQLVLNLPMNGAASNVVLASNVVAFRAEYGLSNAPGAATLSSWQSPALFAGPGTADMSRVRAVRVGLVVRGDQKEKAPIGSATCTASDAKPQLFGETITDPVMVGDEWRCYRYRVLTAVIPMRNIAIGIPPTP
jgi:type IV pilus assembly protein PilW